MRKLSQLIDLLVFDGLLIFEKGFQYHKDLETIFQIYVRPCSTNTSQQHKTTSETDVMDKIMFVVNIIPTYFL